MKKFIAADLFGFIADAAARHCEERAKPRHCEAVLRRSNPVLFLLAYSGGIDSHVLLHAMAQCRAMRPEFKIQLRAIHVNHGLSPNAQDWQQHCQSVCAALNIPLQISRLHLQLAPGDSLEAVARTERYRVFTEMLQADEILLTAHNADDQAETVLLQLMRGAGVKGLAAMPEQKILGAGFQARPLLHFARVQLLQYAQANNLSWIEDESNQNSRFTRNFLRHEIMPLLRQRTPAVARNLARSARHCAEVDVLLKERASEDLRWLQSNKSLSLQKLRQLTPARQANVLRHWISQQGVLLPNQFKLRQILQLIDGVHLSPVQWGNAEVCLGQQFLILNSVIE